MLTRVISQENAMQGFQKNYDFLTSFFIIIVASLLILVAGFKVIQYSSDFKFYTRFVLKWEQSLTLLSSKDTIPPTFSGTNHVQYMDQMIAHMKTLGIPIPKSNTTKPFVYRITRLGADKHQDIFLLGFEQKIVLFGLSKTTFNMLDKKIDNKVDKNNGTFKGKKQTNSEIYTGIWTL